MTLEGCVVRISDIIGYLGRDIEDAAHLGVFNPEDLPKDVVKILGKTNREIINTITLDIINNSLDKPYLKLSKHIYEAVTKLKKFNYKHIYEKSHSKEESDLFKLMFNSLFEKLLLILDKEDKSQNIYQYFLNKMDKNYNQNTSNTRKVIDYIAGMTDNYFISEYESLKDYM